MTTPEEWSETQKSTTVTVDGHELEVAYHESGRDNGGPPVVFLHGIPTWSFLWRDVVGAVNDERHVIAPDLLGYGNSEMRDGFDRSIRAQEVMLSALLAGLDAETVALVGHDIGGGIALRYASHEPDVVTDLVLSNAVCYDSWPVEFVAGLGVPGTVESWNDAELEGKLEFVFEDGLYGDEPREEFVEGMKEPWRSPEGRVSLSRNAVATNTNQTLELDYGAIAADTLLLWGADDVLQPISYAERLAGGVAGDAELVGLDEAYHWVVEDRPEAYRERLRSFLVGGAGTAGGSAR
ncbi:alpha/beta fold hydrolase [Halegenticoccus soli]|uniref:alpha/beta fold hydrolase n=1 Tax=Halegenticoccus soli TaxID=1985678 RepID=UPI000C6D9B6F|nr:alpha/beta hydrolase [Halegenticoccus soli]